MGRLQGSYYTAVIPLREFAGYEVPIQLGEACGQGQQQGGSQEHRRAAFLLLHILHHSASRSQ